MSSKKNRVAGQKRKFEEQDYVVIEIHADDGCVFKILKSRLVKKSPVFKAMFGHDTKENQTNDVKISGFSSIAVLLFLQYFETNKIQCPSQKIADEMFQLADYYQIECLKTRCVQLIYAYLTVDNIFGYFEMAKTFQSIELKETCIDFMCQNISLKTLFPFYEFTRTEEGLEKVLEAIFTFYEANLDKVRKSKEWKKLGNLFHMRFSMLRLDFAHPPMKRSEAPQQKSIAAAQETEDMLAIYIDELGL